MNAHAFRWLAMLAMLCSNVNAEPVVTVFGLPLGGKLPYLLKTCPPDAPFVKVVCWKGKPIIQHDHPTGGIQMPNPDSLPKWTENGRFSLHQDQDGQLLEIIVGEIPAFNSPTIERSIASRFGLPSYKRTSTNGFERRWERSDIEITMRCYDDCLVYFGSASWSKLGVDADSERKKIDAARPTSP